MQPVQITIRDMPSSPALQDHLLKKALKLDHVYNRIQHCKIVVDIPQKHKRNGKLFRVCIDLRVPGKDLIVNRQLDEDVYIAARNAFLALERMLEEYIGKLRGEIKLHEGIDFGHIKRIIPEEEYGFIQDIDGMELYFSLTNVAYPHFNQLQVGDYVHFIKVPASEGWQAHRVTKKNNHHENGS